METVEINAVALAQTASQLQNTRKLVDAGTLPELNAAELEAQLARDSATQVSSQTQVQLNLLVLKAYLNLPADTTFEIDAPSVDRIPLDNILELTPASVYEMAMNTQPQIKMNNLRLQARQKAYEASRGRLYPTFSAFGQLGTNYFSPFKITSVVPQGYQQSNAFALDGANQYPIYTQSFGTATTKNTFGGLWKNYWSSLSNQFGQSIGIAVNVPIFNGWSARANVERAKLDIKNQELLVEQERLRLKQDVYSAYNQAYGAFQTFLAREKAEKTASVLSTLQTGDMN
jgi:outer membrane protein